MKNFHSFAFCCVLAIALTIPNAGPLLADVVTPSERAPSGVHVREQPSASSPSLDVLKPDELAEITDRSNRNWYRVLLPSGITGFVSKAWVRTQTAATPATTTAAELTGDFTIHVVDVGTGLAIVVKGPDFLLVYDGGSNDDEARGPKNRLAAYMRKVFPGPNEIDHLILSHPHADHVELLPDIVTLYPVKNVWDSGAMNPICGYRAFLAAVSKRAEAVYRTPRRDSGTVSVTFERKVCYGKQLPEEEIELRHGARISNAPITLGAGATMQFLHADSSVDGDQFNKYSLVVQLVLAGKRILLMGDAEAGGRDNPTSPPKPNSIERKLLTCCLAQLKSDVMVVGHHGSKTSSRKEFLDAVQARIFVVSSGPHKYSGVTLPDPEIITELNTRGNVLRTNLNDSACASRPAKIGPDKDGKPGGCDNVRISIKNNSAEIGAGYWRGAD